MCRLYCLGNVQYRRYVIRPGLRGKLVSVVSRCKLFSVRSDFFRDGEIQKACRGHFLTSDVFSTVLVRPRSPFLNAFAFRAGGVLAQRLSWAQSQMFNLLPRARSFRDVGAARSLSHGSRHKRSDCGQKQKGCGQILFFLTERLFFTFSLLG